jgi:glycosyltransferase involved in cell wall biosynthesis
MKQASIITSIYNGEKFLHGFLNNVISQNCIDSIEVLLLDACSTDSTEQIIKQYNHPSLIYHKLESRLPITDTMNRAIDLANTEILTFWNIDDRRNNTSLDLQIKYLNNNLDCDVCYGYVAWSFIENQTFEENDLSQIYPCYDVSIESLMINNSPNCLPLWRKKLHKELGYFDTSFNTASDYEFWMRCAANKKRFDKFYGIVGSYYYNPNGLSTNSNSSNAIESELIKSKYKHFLK